MKTETCHFIDDTELEEIIAGLYGYKNFVINQSGANVLIEKNITRNMYMQTDYEKIKNDLDINGATKNAKYQHYLRELIYFGILPVGIYVIELSWH